MKREIPHITDAQRHALRERLRRRAEALLAEISAGLRPGGLDIPPDDRAAGDLNADVGIAAVQRDTEELCAIEEALRRMADGDYGLCIACGAAIPWLRLHARPESSRCVRCETETERGRAPAATL